MVVNNKRSIRYSSIYGLIFIVIWFGFWEYCFQTAPRFPDQENNRVYVENYHGTKLYLNKTEYIILWGIPGTTVLIAITSFLFEKYKKTQPKILE